jgi:hypothetical protein
MRNLGPQSFRLAIAVMALGMSATSAHAYLDPGTGSMILQLLSLSSAGRQERSVEPNERGRR